MKTIIVLDNLFASDMIADYEYLRKNLDMNKYNLISPLMFSQRKNPYDDKDFATRVIASAIGLGEMYYELGNIKSIVEQNKTTIYFGMAQTKIPAEDVYVVNPVVLDAQEALIDNYLKEAKIDFNYIKSSRASKSFSNINELVEFLNDL